MRRYVYAVVLADFEDFKKGKLYQTLGGDLDFHEGGRVIYVGNRCPEITSELATGLLERFADKAARSGEELFYDLLDELEGLDAKATADSAEAANETLLLLHPGEEWGNP